MGEAYWAAYVEHPYHAVTRATRGPGTSSDTCNGSGPPATPSAESTPQAL